MTPQWEINELKRQIQNLYMEISNIKERLEDIKPIHQFLREVEEREEAEREIEEDEDLDTDDNHSFGSYIEDNFLYERH